MFKQWVEKLSGASADNREEQADMRQISIQLLMEVARCDNSISEPEREKIARTLYDRSGLSDTELSSVLDSAEEAVDSSISFHAHVRLINDNFSREQKTGLIEQMWEVAYADNELDQYEEAFIRQVADLIYVRHRDFIQTKLKVIERSNR